MFFSDARLKLIIIIVSMGKIAVKILIKALRVMETMSGKSRRKTKAMVQYDNIKKDLQDTIVFFQLGDFYETFYEDAKIASKVLDITLTSRGMGTNGEKIPLAGVPVKAIDVYLKKMIDEGYKVAIVDQTEDAKKVPSGKIVKRNITRIVTPGTVFETSILDKTTNNFLLSLVIEERRQTIGFALVDISTGEFLVTEFNDNVIEQFKDEFTRFKPREIIIPDSNELGQIYEALKETINTDSRNVVYKVNETFFNYDTAKKRLLDHFEINSLAGFGCESMNEGIRAAGAIISYLSLLKNEYPNNITSLKTLDNRNYLILDSNAQRNLEIIANTFDGKVEGSLLSIFSDLSTSMGMRLLKRWLLQPLRDIEEINDRLNAVEEFRNDINNINRIVDFLSVLADFQRLITKIKYKSVNARDLIALKNSLSICSEIHSFLRQNQFNSKIIQRIIDFEISSLLFICTLIDEAIVDEPPASLHEAGLIKPSFNEELEQLYRLKGNQNKILKEIEQKEQARTKFKINLGYNSVHGYYLEVTKAQIRDAGGDSVVPSDYIRRQTLVNAERFITPELKEIEEKILNLDENLQELEYNLFCEIREKISPFVSIIRNFSELIAELDVLICFAFTALKNNYCKPIIIESPIIKIINGRHPVVEQVQKGTGFIPNDTLLNEGELNIITGPNMSGKSTFLRQVALIVLMAQTGSWVPAEKCTFGIIDKIFTRVGAFDRLAFGQSTFMLEMLETAHILHNATPNSLIILDEVGRGTSTFDGLSLAWAIVMHIATELKSKTLFATHYHQISELESFSPKIKNFHQTAMERNGKLVLLYKIKQGSTDHSFGISVAKMGGIPKSIILEAQKKLLKLEAASNGFVSLDLPKKIKGKPRQLSLAEALSKNVLHEKTANDLNNLRLEVLAFLKRYSDIDINHLTPIEALQELGHLVQDMKELEKKVRGE